MPNLPSHDPGPPNFPHSEDETIISGLPVIRPQPIQLKDARPSFLAQCHHRIDAHRSSRRNVARKQCLPSPVALQFGKKASIGRSTLDALENGRIGELGFSKITKILSALGMELKLQEMGSRRPTLDELMQEDRDDQGLDRRR
jgi:HTH-type transcriptional regulator / antitoxin HipB